MEQLLWEHHNMGMLLPLHTIFKNDVYDFIEKSNQPTQNELIAKAKEDKNYLNQIKNKIIEDGIINVIKNKCKTKKVKKDFSEVVN